MNTVNRRLCLQATLGSVSAGSLAVCNHTDALTPLVARVPLRFAVASDGHLGELSTTPEQCFLSAYPIHTLR